MLLDPRRCAPGGALILCLNACSMGGTFAKQPPVEPVVQERPPTEASQISPLLEIMEALPTGDPARQTELFQSAKEGVALSPTTTNRLRLALAYATPGHAASDPVAARRQLAELLATPETLLPVERLLAQVELQDVDQRLIILAENKQLQTDETQESKDRLLGVNRRLAAEVDENARLRKSLDEARAKLEAVTHIERSINDRGTNGSHTP